MNQPPDLESEAIRSDIDQTRERMDETINQIGSRLDGRHIVDEVLGFFRRSDAPGRVGSQIGRTAESALHSVGNTVKENPVPVLMIGAGIAWMIYRSSRSQRADEQYYSAASADEAGGYGEEFSRGDFPDENYSGEGASAGAYTDQPLSEKAGSVAAQAKEKLSNLGSSAREKLSSAGERGRQTFEAAKGKVGEIAGQVQERSREIYSRTREQVSTTAQQHPLEVGLACLAVGLIAGLSIPTPERVNRSIGATADRLRQQTRQRGSELVDKGKRVVQAAAAAAKEEARTQGLTSETLHREARAVVDKASEAGRETARQEGLMGQAEAAKAGNAPGTPPPSGSSA